MDSAKSSSASETAKAINDILKLPQQDQGALGDVIDAWLDLDGREGSPDDENESSDDDDNHCDEMDTDGTGI